MSDLYLGDCREIRSALPDNSVDTIITDPPYGLEFMGKGWDKGVPGVEFWREFLAVAKPGAMLLAFGGTRTFHRMTCAIEDAGWEIRDCLMWLYGSGFPKSLDISKAIDKAKGAEREVLGHTENARPNRVGKETKLSGPMTIGGEITKPQTDLARQWSGYGTALKPAWEPIIVAMKPLEGTFAENAEKWGVAGINVDGGRIGTADDLNPSDYDDSKRTAPKFSGTFNGGKDGQYRERTGTVPNGRWPANLLLDEEAAGMLDGQSGVTKSPKTYVRGSDGYSTGNSGIRMIGESAGKLSQNFADSGGASRFFYVAKASKRERGEGNIHPTVKPIKLMEYLCTLTKTPTGGIVLDPFAGSGTTLLAARNTGREYIGIEQNPEYFQIIKARLGI